MEALSGRQAWTAAETARSSAGARPATSASVPIGRAAWVALAILALLNMTNYFDRLIVTVVAQPVKLEFALSDTQLGLLTGPAFITVYCIASVFFGWLVDRRSRKVVLAAVLALWSAMTIAGGLARNYGQLLVARAGVGVGEGGSNPAAMSLMSDYFPRQRRSTAAAIFTSVGMIGILLSFLAGGWVAETYGWRAAFFMAGAPGLLIAILILLAVDEPVRGAIDRQPHKVLPFPESARLLWRIRPYPWLIVGLGVGAFGNLGMMQWLPLFFIRSHGLSLSQVGLFFGPVLVSGLIAGMLLGGWAGDRLARRSTGHMMVIGIVSNVAVVPLYWAALWVPSLPVALGLTLVAAAMSVFYSPMGYAVIQTLAPTSVRGTALGIFNIFGGIIGQAILPVIVGMLSDALTPRFGSEGLRIALTICMLICLIASLIFVHVKRLVDAADAPAAEGGEPQEGI